MVSKLFCEGTDAHYWLFHFVYGLFTWSLFLSKEVQSVICFILFHAYKYCVREDRLTNAVDIFNFSKYFNLAYYSSLTLHQPSFCFHILFLNLLCCRYLRDHSFSLYTNVLMIHDVTSLGWKRFFVESMPNMLGRSEYVWACSELKWSAMCSTASCASG